MKDYTPEYHAYFVTFYSTILDPNDMPYSKQKCCVVLAENSVTAESMAEKLAEKYFPNNCNSNFITRLMSFHDISPFSDIDTSTISIIHYNPDD